MTELNELKLFIAAAVGALTGFWGWLGWLVVGWVVLMVLDYLTGSLAAAKAGEWASQKAREGLWHKAGMIFVVLVAAGTDLLLSLVLGHLPLLELPFTYSGLVCPVVLVWYIITELGSVCENAVAMGAPVPPLLLKLLAVSKQTADHIGEELGKGEE